MKIIRNTIETLNECIENNSLLVYQKTDKNGDCNICLEEDIEIVITKCKHEFCISCIERWYNENKKNPRCPLCRRELEVFK
ncbi:RING-finger-containing E3 ubiquitin ligase [Dasineura jujubifolia toursvirus 2a]|nr:RING-finger-containing E3 ubiquitin ligase [Dasineura jujubifolia toursvirus 2a]